jgi:hypothetical protein
LITKRQRSLLSTKGSVNSLSLSPIGKPSGEFTVTGTERHECTEHYKEDQSPSHYRKYRAGNFGPKNDSGTGVSGTRPATLLLSLQETLKATILAPIGCSLTVTIWQQNPKKKKKKKKKECRALPADGKADSTRNIASHPGRRQKNVMRKNYIQYFIF